MMHGLDRPQTGLPFIWRVSPARDADLGRAARKAKRPLAWLARFGASLVAVWLAGAALAQDAAPGSADAGPPVRSLGPAIHYRGSVQWYVADLKTSFPEHKSYSAQSALTPSNYVAVLNGLKRKVGVNGVRLPIFPGESDPASYSKLYKDVFAYARNIGLAVYASPMSVGMRDYQGWSDQQYAQWLARYVNYFQPEFLSPFNEPGISDERVISIVGQLRSMLTAKTLIMGPDRQHVDRTVESLQQDSEITHVFDIVDSHNANRDRSATRSNWAALVQMEGKPVWASEDPANWSVGADPSLPGIGEAVDAGVQGVVIWAAKPSLIDDRGEPTQKAREIASHLAN